MNCLHTLDIWRDQPRIVYLRKVSKHAIVGLLAWAAPALAEDTIYPAPETPPVEIRAFIEPGRKLLNMAHADLNGDGREDVILVLEKEGGKETRDISDNQRALLILIRDAHNALKLSKRNDKIVHCSTCGGMMGDPFQPVVAGLKTFTVSAYGGSSWRWSVEYKFDYSRIDDTWQLVRIKEATFHSSEPDKGKSEVFTPPNDYGKIDIADFDRKNWKGQGKK